MVEFGLYGLEFGAELLFYCLVRVLNRCDELRKRWMAN